MRILVWFLVALLTSPAIFARGARAVGTRGVAHSQHAGSSVGTGRPASPRSTYPRSTSSRMEIQVKAPAASSRTYSSRRLGYVPVARSHGTAVSTGGVRSAPKTVSSLSYGRGFGTFATRTNLRYCGSCGRDTQGRIARSSAAKRDFMRETGYPSSQTA